jgi:hypothetical protein
MDIEKRLAGIERRLAALENGESVIEMDLTLPESDIDGLLFNETKVHAVFEKQDDGWYYSRDILFMSARNVEDDNGRDILMEYIYDTRIRKQIADALGVHPADIRIALPDKPQGVKKYNGVDCWYWLAPPYFGSTSSFCATYTDGSPSYNIAFIVRGVAPAFRIEKEVAL